MPKTDDVERDLALTALESLSDVATSSANELNLLNEELSTMQRRRRRGWTWRRIVSSGDQINPLSAVGNIAADLARAGNRCRRALVRALHAEGA